jgi:SAM-dependent methyltransferase
MQYLRMNKSHEMCGSDEWRTVVREAILPWALGGIDLGDDVLEVGPGYGATTDVLAESALRLTAVEIDPVLAAGLIERFAGNAAVIIIEGDATNLDLPEDHFSGAASFTMLHHLSTDDRQDRLFAEVGRVLRSGAPFVVGDSLASAELEELHDGDTYHPVDPDHLTGRLEAAGFSQVDVKTNPFGWAAVGRKL